MASPKFNLSSPREGLPIPGGPGENPIQQRWIGSDLEPAEGGRLRWEAPAASRGVWAPHSRETAIVVVQLIALVKPFRAQAVLAALESVEFLGGTVREAMGYGRQKSQLRRYLGSEYNASFLPKVELTLFLAESEVPAAIRAIVGPARTGRMGDGKIIIVPCLDSYASWSS